MQGISYNRKTELIMMITAVTPVMAIHAIVSQNLRIVAAFQLLKLQQKAMVGITQNNPIFTIKPIGKARESSLPFIMATSQITMK